MRKLVVVLLVVVGVGGAWALVRRGGDHSLRSRSRSAPRAIDRVPTCDSAALFARLGRGTSRERRAAALDLARRGRADPAIAEQLIEHVLRSEHLYAAIPAAVVALAAMGDDALPHLLKLMRHDDTRLQCAALRALQLMGPGARSAAPAVADHLTRTTDNRVAEAIGAALLAMDEDLAGELVQRLVRFELSRDIVVSVSSAFGKPLAQELGEALAGARASPAHGRLLVALDALGKNSRPALPKILEALRDRSRVDRLGLVSVLDQMEVVPVEAYPLLAEVLQASMTNERNGAVVQRSQSGERLDLALLRVLGRLGPAAEGTAPIVRELLGHTHPYVRSEALGTLVALGDERTWSRELTRMWQSGSDDEREALRSMIRERAPAMSPRLDEFVRALRRSQEARSSIADFVAAFDTVASEWMQRALASGRRADVELATEVATRLESIPPALAVQLRRATASPDRARLRKKIEARLMPLADIRRLLQAEDDSEYYRGLSLLDQAIQDRRPIGEALEPIRGYLRTKRADRVDDSLQIVYRVGADAIEAVPELVELLRDARHRVGAATALGYMGPEARSALPALMRYLEDPRPEVRRTVLSAVSAISPDIETIVIALDDLDSSVRRSAIAALAAVGGEDVLRYLVPLSKMGTREIRSEAVKAIAKLARESEEARSFLSEVAANSAEDELIRDVARAALADLSTGRSNR